MLTPSPEFSSQTDALIEAFNGERGRVIDSARTEQQEIDPDGLFSCLPETERSRLLNALSRFFLLKYGQSQSLPISREEAARVFNEARKMGNLPTTQKLFAYFVATVKEHLADVYGIELKQVAKKVLRNSNRSRNTEKESFVFYLRSLLPPPVRSELLTPYEMALNGVIAVLIDLVVVNGGTLSRQEAINSLSQIGFQEGTTHEMFGKWESTIFETSVKRRYLLCNRQDEEIFTLGEAALDEFPDSQLEDWFQEL